MSEARAPDARSGLDAGGEWTPAFEGQRPPAGEGNTLALRHGSYALLQLRPRADQLAEGLRAAMGDSYEPRFEGALAGTAMVGAQLERAMGAIAEAARPADLARLDQDARGWMRLWLSALAALGLTPAAAGRLRLASSPPSPVARMQPKAGEP